MPEKIREKVHSAFVDSYLGYNFKSIPRRLFKISFDEINGESLKFFESIPIELLENDFDFEMNKLYVKIKTFENNCFLAELNKIAKNNYHEIGNVAIKNALIEAKVHIDKYNNLTTMFLLNQCKMQEVMRTTTSFGGDNIWGADLIYDADIPEKNIYAICHYDGNEIGEMICENFGIEVGSDKKTIDIFETISIKIFEFEDYRVSRIKI